jgi:undecaprenyl phosphate-alpha-L-ara4FN deformylase
MTRLAVKVDVDTLRGYREGVPHLLDLFKKHGLRVSIFFSFGPDNSGRAIRRIFRRGFISKMIRTRAPSTYGLKTLMYGTLLPAPMIVPSAPDVFRRAVREGHDCGVHAWDHVYVQDCLQKISAPEFRVLFEKAAGMFQDLAGYAPRAYAAPGWQVSQASFTVLQELGLDYCSDVRGTSPFLPVFRGHRYGPVQIPTTLPTMDEICGLPGIGDSTIPEIWLKGLVNDWNVVTVHAEMEGMSKLCVLDRFLTMARERSIQFYTLSEYARMAPAVPCAVTAGRLEGRAGTLAVQERNHNG